MRTCTHCLKEKDLKEFYKRKSNPQGYQWQCKVCISRKYRRPPLSSRRKNMQNRLGISLEEYADILKTQGGVCAICHNPPKSIHLAVDHCHTTGDIRGILCSSCNIALGMNI